MVSIKIGVVARVDVVVRQRAAHVHVDVLSEAGTLFDGSRRGEILVLVLALGLLVELELARAATHFFLMPRSRSERVLKRTNAAYPLKIEELETAKIEIWRVSEQKSRRSLVRESLRRPT